MCIKIDGTVKNLLFLVSDFREIILSNFSTSKIVIIGTVIWGIFQDDKLYFNLHLSLQNWLTMNVGHGMWKLTNYIQTSEGRGRFIYR